LKSSSFNWIDGQIILPYPEQDPSRHANKMHPGIATSLAFYQGIFRFKVDVPRCIVWVME